MIPAMVMGAIAKKHPVQDPQYNSVKALLHFDNNLVDQKSHTFTATGTAAPSATESVFGGYSLNVPSGTNYISSPDSSDWTFASDPFTLEAWVYRNSVSGTNVICSRWGAAGPAYIWYFDGANGRLVFKCLFFGVSTTIEWTLDHNTASVWDYVSVSRQFSNGFAHQNGVPLTRIGAPNINSTMNNGNRPLHIGINDDGNIESFDGYIDDFRLTKGVGRYGAGSYTVPSAAHPNS